MEKTVRHHTEMAVGMQKPSGHLRASTASSRSGDARTTVRCRLRLQRPDRRNCQMRIPPLCLSAPSCLVVSPIVAACSSCHDSAIAVDHMQTNGGSFYEPRATAFSKQQQEECLLCHGPGKLASIADRHAFLP